MIAVADGAGGTGRGARAAELSVARLAAAAQLRELDPTAAEGCRSAARCHREAKPRRHRSPSPAARSAGARVGDCAAWIVATDGAVEMLTARQHRKPLSAEAQHRLAFHAPFAIGTLVVGTDGLFAYASTGRITAACAKRRWTRSPMP